MTSTEMLDALVANWEALSAKYTALIKAGDLFAADDMEPDLRQAIRAAHDAFMGC